MTDVPAAIHSDTGTLSRFRPEDHRGGPADVREDAVSCDRALRYIVVGRTRQILVTHWRHQIAAIDLGRVIAPDMFSDGSAQPAGARMGPIMAG